MIKIGPYLPKLLQEKFGAVFFGPPCRYHTYDIHIQTATCKDVLFLAARLVAYWPAPIHAVVFTLWHC